MTPQLGCHKAAAQEYTFIVQLMVSYYVNKLA